MEQPFFIQPLVITTGSFLYLRLPLSKYESQIAEER